MSRVVLALVTVFFTTVSAAAPQPLVTQKGRLFTPGSLTVKAGEEVLFQNDDNVSHHVYSSTDGNEFSLDTMKPGQKAGHTFAAKGRVDVRCGLHPGMRLVLTVE
jgi:plastocyanin